MAKTNQLETAREELNTAWELLQNTKEAYHFGQTTEAAVSRATQDYNEARREWAYYEASTGN